MLVSFIAPGLPICWSHKEISLWAINEIHKLKINISAHTFANDDHRSGKMKWWDELCCRLWACWPDAKPPASRLQQETHSTHCRSTHQTTRVLSCQVKINKKAMTDSTTLVKYFFFFYQLVQYIIIKSLSASWSVSACTTHKSVLRNHYLICFIPNSVTE